MNSPASQAQDRRLRAGKRTQWLWALGAAVGASTLLYAEDPAGGSLVPPCPIYAVTGLYCPGCGTARAMHQLLHGKLGAALRLNPLLAVLLPVLGYSYLSLTREVFFGESLPNFRKSGLYNRLLIALVMAFSVLRNIPAYPFSLLAPKTSRPGRGG